MHSRIDEHWPNCPAIQKKYVINHLVQLSDSRPMGKIKLFKSNHGMSPGSKSPFYILGIRSDKLYVASKSESLYLADYRNSADTPLKDVIK